MYNSTGLRNILKESKNSGKMYAEVLNYNLSKYEELLSK